MPLAFPRPWDQHDGQSHSGGHARPAEPAPAAPAPAPQPAPEAAAELAKANEKLAALLGKPKGPS